MISLFSLEFFLFWMFSMWLLIFVAINPRSCKPTCLDILVHKSFRLHQHTELASQFPTVYQTIKVFVHMHSNRSAGHSSGMKRYFLLGSCDSYLNLIHGLWRLPRITVRFSARIGWHGYLPFGLSSCPYAFIYSGVSHHVWKIFAIALLHEC